MRRWNASGFRFTGDLMQRTTLVIRFESGMPFTGLDRAQDFALHVLMTDESALFVNLPMLLVPRKAEHRR